MVKRSYERGLKASVEGFANEHIVAGILMKKYQNVSLVDLPLSRYDLIIARKKKRRKKEDLIRAQVKTAKKSIGFTGGGRGGVDRFYKSRIKVYLQSTSTSDVIIGLEPKGNDAFDLYFVPTILVEKLDQKSISINKIQKLKNNYEMLEKCKNINFVISECAKYGLIPRR